MLSVGGLQLYCSWWPLVMARGTPTSFLASDALSVSMGVGVWVWVWVRERERKTL
jgi:hypothetical protein